jgi:hypothetical protein
MYILGPRFQANQSSTAFDLFLVVIQKRLILVAQVLSRVIDTDQKHRLKKAIVYLQKYKAQHAANPTMKSKRNIRRAFQHVCAIKQPSTSVRLFTLKHTVRKTFFDPMAKAECAHFSTIHATSMEHFSHHFMTTFNTDAHNIPDDRRV